MAGLLGDLASQGTRIGKEQLGTLAPVVRAFFQSFVKAPEAPHNFDSLWSPASVGALFPRLG
jgi:hypothetical protein